jgi:hypothetical protein
MPLTAAGQNLLVSGGLGNSITHVSAVTAFSATPTEHGSRQAVTWNAASGGQRTNNGAIAFSVTGGTTIIGLGLHSASTAGTVYGYNGIGTSLLSGIATVANTGDVFTSYAHGLANTNRVFVIDVLAGTLPTGLAEGTVYYVVGATTDTFQVSATSGGAAVTISADGECAWFQTKPETFGSDGTLNVADTTLVLDATAYGTI